MEELGRRKGDSSWEHEVVHDGNDTRIILILDIWHPEVLPRDQIL